MRRWLGFAFACLASMLQIFSASDDTLRSDMAVAMVGSGIAVGVMTAFVVAVGAFSGIEAQVLMEASLPTVRFLCSALMTATATTLALMLTLLSMSGGADERIRPSHYRRIQQIAFVDVVAFVGATLLLAVLMIPFSEVSKIPANVYDVIYYATTGAAALLSGLLVAIMLMLYAAARDLIVAFSPADANPLAAEQAEEAAEDASEAADEADNPEAEAKAEDAEQEAREAESAAS